MANTSGPQTPQGPQRAAACEGERSIDLHRGIRRGVGGRKPGRTRGRRFLTGGIGSYDYDAGHGRAYPFAVQGPPAHIVRRDKKNLRQAGHLGQKVGI